MKFGERFLSSQYAPWSEHYVDYSRLKRLLRELFDLDDEASSSASVVTRRRRPSPHRRTRSHGWIAPEEEEGEGEGGEGGWGRRRVVVVDSTPPSRDDGDAPRPHPPSSSSSSSSLGRLTTTGSFESELKFELRKSLYFLLSRTGELISDLSNLAVRRRSTSDDVRAIMTEAWREASSADADDEHRPPPPMMTGIDDAIGGGGGGGGGGIGGVADPRREIRDRLLGVVENLRTDYLVVIGGKLLLLLEFVEYNVEAIIKIVKKHDKLLAEWEGSHLDRDGGCRYSRLRREYLPRFAVFSSDPNVRCLFGAAADAGNDRNDSGRADGGMGNVGGGGGGVAAAAAGRGSESGGGFGGWDVVQWELGVALRELFELEGTLRGGASTMTRTTTTTRFGGVDAMDAPSIARPGPQQSHRRSFSAMGLLRRGLSSVGLFDDATKEAEVRPLVRTHVKSASHLSGFFANGGLGRPIESIMNRSSTFVGLGGLELSLSASTGRSECTARRFFEPMMYRIRSQRRRMGQTHNRYESMIYAHEMLGITGTRHVDDGSGSADVMLESIRRQSIGSEADGKMMMIMEETYSTYPTVSSFSKLLNLASAGLFMCNFNIIAPTSGLYANLSLNMVLMGRFLIGFGSTRVINRRYIADYYSIEDRTSGMADFVFSSALGMTAGPAIAASLSIVAPSNQSPTNSYWTIETAPGYVMFVLWSAYLCCNLMFFEEPDRNNHSEKNSSVSSSKAITMPSESIPLLNVASASSSRVQVEKGGPSYAASIPCETSPLLILASVFRVSMSSVNIPVLVTMILLTLLKSVLETLSSSAPTISRHYFGWGVNSSGIYLAAQASFVLPTTFFISQISRKQDDRELILGTLLVMFVGILGFLEYGEGVERVDHTGGYSESRFIFFGIVIFSACNALEVPTMGLLSKTIPKSLANGVLNAGLLATEAGTIGRVLGDIWFSRATFMGLDQMLDRTFAPMCAMVGLAIVVALFSYPYLQPNFQADSEDEDDDDD
ncbi:hypothetical protein ACHAW5_000009 [Stephanodiscus triporus]|uniref:SPX domain-containing protein n=1 Tax=Stephanodiscus triporus TaxID=2934178 RepID=A0ABD3MWF6_9STRA